MRTEVLTGGVVGSRFLWGLAQEMDRKALTAIVSKADDLELHGLRISPNLDAVTYTLADRADAKRGRGLAGDTCECLKLLAQYGQPTWWRLDDRDLATRIFRAHAIRQGQRLTEGTDRIRHAKQPDRQHRADEAQAGEIEALGVRVCVGKISVRAPEDKRQVARLALKVRDSL